MDLFLRPRTARERIIVAVDLAEEQAVRSCIRRVGKDAGVAKLGLEAMNAIGTPRLVTDVCWGVERIMLDAKLHDVPNTMGRTARQFDRLGVWAFTIHASAGKRAIKACVENRGQALVLGVTILTSHTAYSTRETYGDRPIKKVLQFAGWLLKAGAQGIVCSPKEALAVRKAFGSALIIFTPGIRPLWAPRDDQRRVMTPAEAIAAGVDYLIIGRPILDPPRAIGTPENAIARIVEEIRSLSPSSPD